MSGIETDTYLHPLFTIGYSAFLEPDVFIGCLQENGINALVDVRGFPNQTSFEQFKGDNLKRLLRDHRIHYLSFAEEFGVRPKEAR